MTTAEVIDADVAAIQLGVDATVGLKLSADGALTGRPERGAKGGFVVPAAQVAELDPDVLEAARRHVAGLRSR